MSDKLIERNVLFLARSYAKCIDEAFTYYSRDLYSRAELEKKVDYFYSKLERILNYHVCEYDISFKVYDKALAIFKQSLSKLSLSFGIIKYA